MSRSWGRSNSRRSMLTRVGELLTGHSLIWLIGVAVGLTFIVGMSVLGPASSLLLANSLVIIGAVAFVFKDRVLIVRRRIVFTRQRLSRRQFLATMLSISITAALAALSGWMLGNFILSGYEEQVRRHLTRQPQKK